MSNQYSRELPKDALGQKTTAAPREEIHESEWTTPVHLSGSDIAYDPKDDMHKIKSMQQKWRAGFSGSALNPEKWDIVQVGAGQTVSVVNGELRITAGTTPNAETIIISKQSFTVPFRTMMHVVLSQRIANNNFFLEMVSVEKESGEPNSDSRASWHFDGTTATQAKYIVNGGDQPPLVSALSTTQSTAPTAGAIFEIEPTADECWFFSRLADSTNGRANSYVRHLQIPNPNLKYKLQIRVVNGATAPASSTTFTSQFANISDYAELTAEITAGRGGAVAGQSLAATLTGGSTSVIQASGNPIAGWSVANFPGTLTGMLDFARSQTNTEFSVNMRNGTPKAGVDIPTWQFMRYSPVTSSVAGSCMVTDRRGTNRFAYAIFGASSFWRYDTWTDSWQQLASPGVLGGSGTWGAGTCMAFDPNRGTQGWIWLVTGHTTTAGFGYYDIGAGTWTSRTVPSGAWATDGQLIHTCSAYNAAGNDDFLYLFGNNGTTVRRYSISGNTWASMTASPATLGAGLMAFWGYSQNTANIYVFRGAGTPTLYAYSISGNSWTTLNTVPAIETYNTGSCGCYMPSKNSFIFQKDNTHRMYELDLATLQIIPAGTAPYTPGTTIAGDGMFDVVAPTGERFIYFRRHSSTELFRTMAHWL